MRGKHKFDRKGLTIRRVGRPGQVYTRPICFFLWGYWKNHHKASVNLLRGVILLTPNTWLD